MEKKINIPKDFFKELDFKLQVPTILCPICEEEILDTPTNRLLTKLYEPRRNNKKAGRGV